MQLTAGDLEALALGAALLGSGGGGDPFLALQLARRALPEGAPGIPVVPADALPPGGLVPHIGLTGSGDVVAERPPAGDEFARVVRATEEHLGAEAVAVGVSEIGGMNALLPVIAAAQLGLPLVDGDLMGRAFPSVAQTTLAMAGIRADPMILTGLGGGGMAVLVQEQPRALERMAKGTVAGLGGAAVVAQFPIRAGTLAAYGVPGSISRTVELGRALLAAGDVPVPEALAGLGVRCLFRGRIVEARREISLPVRSLVLEGAADPSSFARIDLAEEYLACSVDGDLAAATPEVICLLDPHTRRPVAAMEAQVGRHALVLTPPSPRRFGAGDDAVVGPEAFGLRLRP